MSDWLSEHFILISFSALFICVFVGAVITAIKRDNLDTQATQYLQNISYDDLKSCTANSMNIIVEKNNDTATVIISSNNVDSPIDYIVSKDDKSQKNVVIKEKDK